MDLETQAWGRIQRKGQGHPGKSSCLCGRRGSGGQRAPSWPQAPRHVHLSHQRGSPDSNRNSQQGRHKKACFGVPVRGEGLSRTLEDGQICQRTSQGSSLCVRPSGGQGARARLPFSHSPERQGHGPHNVPHLCHSEFLQPWSFLVPPGSPFEQSSYLNMPAPSLGEIPPWRNAGLLCCCSLVPGTPHRTQVRFPRGSGWSFGHCTPPPTLTYPGSKAPQRLTGRG